MHVPRVGHAVVSIDGGTRTGMLSFGGEGGATDSSRPIEMYDPQLACVDSIYASLVLAAARLMF